MTRRPEPGAAVAAGTACARDLSYLGADLPLLDAARCTGCMDCVNVCPDAALRGCVLPEPDATARLSAIADPGERAAIEAHFVRTTKLTEAARNRGLTPALFGLFVDPARCKGCGECVTVCPERALSMTPKQGDMEARARSTFAFAETVPEPPAGYVQERLPADWLLTARARLYSGGASSCRGCGEATALRMMLAANGFSFGADAVAVVAATGCNTVFGGTWPHNPFQVPWTSSLADDAPAVAMGVRVRYDQRGLDDKKIWVVGESRVLCEGGFASTSRLLASGLDVNVLSLDTQPWPGEHERRRELGVLALMHGDVYVAQTTTAHLGHFYRAIVDAATFRGPAIVNVYCACPPDHGITDDVGARQARLAVTSRAFPLFVYDPRRGATIKDRLSLQGNPSLDGDWHTDATTGEPADIVAFARTQGRYAGELGRDGRPSTFLASVQAERLQSWRRLRELAGLV